MVTCKTITPGRTYWEIIFTVNGHKVTGVGTFRVRQWRRWRKGRRGYVWTGNSGSYNEEFSLKFCYCHFWSIQSYIGSYFACKTERPKTTNFNLFICKPTGQWYGEVREALLASHNIAHWLWDRKPFLLATSTRETSASCLFRMAPVTQCRTIKERIEPTRPTTISGDEV